MYRGDRARKETLVRHGFRLPSALDNRPLRFDEFEKRVSQAIYVSATPGSYELEKTEGRVVEQLVRPTGLLDPSIEVRPADTEVDDLLDEIHIVVGEGDRVLVTVLTKRMAQELTNYYEELGVRVRYLHSDIGTLERMDIIRDLRAGEFDVLVGINLLREGLDLPEVALVAILDADKSGYLRSERSLIQTIGRAARNVKGRCILYANEVSRAMRVAIDETERRRAIQERWNDERDITPRSVVRSVDSPLSAVLGDYVDVPTKEETQQLAPAEFADLALEDIPKTLRTMRSRMKAHAEKLEFEQAAELRDQLKALEAWAMKLSGDII